MKRKMDRVMDTETEAIHLALDEVHELACFREETETGLRDLLGHGGFVDYFAPPTSTQPHSMKAEIIERKSPDLMD